MSCMEARSNYEPGESTSSSQSLPMPERSELRYRLAQLLTIEKFDEALNDAIVAYSQGKIFEVDLRFVVEVVKSAERAGRTQNLKAKIPKTPTSGESETVHSKRDVVIRVLGELRYEFV
jgi:hypothetical protein